MQTLQTLQALTNTVKGIQIKAACDLYKTDSKQAILAIDTPLFSARCAIQGAQLLEFTTQGKPLLWLSDTAIFDGKTPIRGGIPICLPWFGVNQRQPALSKHGFARNQDWTLIACTNNNNVVELIFGFTFNGNEDFSHSFEANLKLTLSEKIKTTLTIQNNSNKAAPFSFALHSYFNVPNSQTAKVKGLDKLSYLDNTDNLKTVTQQGDIGFIHEVDRVYEHCTETQHLNDAISISSNDMPTAIVWNPCNDSIKDIGTQYTQFICVERGAAFANELILQPGERYTGTQYIATK